MALVSIALAFLLCPTARADVDDVVLNAMKGRPVSLELQDGTRIPGELLDFDASEVVLVLSDGTVRSVRRTELEQVFAGSAAPSPEPSPRREPAPEPSAFGYQDAGEVEDLDRRQGSGPVPREDGWFVGGMLGPLYGSATQEVTAEYVLDDDGDRIESRIREVFEGPDFWFYATLWAGHRWGRWAAEAQLGFQRSYRSIWVAEQGLEDFGGFDYGSDYVWLPRLQVRASRVFPEPVDSLYALGGLSVLNFPTVDVHCPSSEGCVGTWYRGQAIRPVAAAALGVGGDVLRRSWGTLAVELTAQAWLRGGKVRYEGSTPEFGFSSPDTFSLWLGFGYQRGISPPSSK